MRQLVSGVLRGPRGGVYHMVNGKKVSGPPPKKQKTDFEKGEAKKSLISFKNEIQRHKEGSELYHLAMHGFHKNMAIVTGDKKHKELSEKHFEISDHLGRVKEHLASMNLPKFHPYNQRYADQANERLAKLRADLASILKKK
jgi:hypothetical protein